MKIKSAVIIALIAFIILPFGGFFVFKYLEGKLHEQETSTKLHKLWKIPNYKFTDQHGIAFTQDSLNNTIYLADFFFTACPTMCPRLTANLKKVQEKFRTIALTEPSFKFKIISYSIDPDRDTPEKLEQYAEKYKANYYMWRFLTGPRDSIYSVAMNGYKAAVKKNTTAVEEFTHSGYIFLVDKNGWVRKYYQGDGIINMDSITNDVLRLSGEKN